MSSPDRERIAELLEDPTLSYRAIGRMTGASDWTVRRVARELDGDTRPMKQPRRLSEEIDQEVSQVAGWLVLGGFVAVLALSIWAGVRWTSPLDSTDFSHGFYPNPHSERTNDETQFPE